jgi:hypothetical protein
VFTVQLHSNGSYSIVAAGMCLPIRCLTIHVYSDFNIPAFGRHVTLSYTFLLILQVVGFKQLYPRNINIFSLLFLLQSNVSSKNSNEEFHRPNISFLSHFTFLDACYLIYLWTNLLSSEQEVMFRKRKEKEFTHISSLSVFYNKSTWNPTLVRSRLF